MNQEQEYQEWKLDKESREIERYKKGEITHAELERRLQEIGRKVPS